MKTTGKNVLFSLIVIIGLFVILEGTQRVRYAFRHSPGHWLLYGLRPDVISSVGEILSYDVEKKGDYYKLTPGFTQNETPHGTQETYVNSYGLRGPDFSLEKSPDVFRIAVLGGSSTFGAFNGEEETFPAILQHLLDARAGSGRFEVINAGLPGANPAMLRHLLREEILPLRPDLILIMSMYNHYTVTSEGDPRNRLALLRRFLENRSLLFLTLSEKLTYFTNKNSFLDRLYVQFSDYRGYMEEMVDVAKSNGVDVYLIKQPVLIKGETPKNVLADSLALERAWDRDFYVKVLKVVETVGRDQGLPVLDASTITGAVHVDMLYDAVHLTREGNETIAREIFREMERSGPLAKQ